MPTNDFLPFCPTDTGTNLLTQSDYSADSQRTIGNQPGVARSKLNNKAIRQANAIASQLAQLVTNKTSADVLDDGVSAKLLAQITSALTAYAPVLTKYTASSGTHKLSYIFAIASGSATVGAVYTNNGANFTVKATVASGVLLTATGDGNPTVSGTLTKFSGTGDATLTFYAVRKPISIDVLMVGGGGGGSGSAVFASGDGHVGGSGGDTTFGVMTAGGGFGAIGGSGVGQGGGAGGVATLGSGPVGLNIDGSAGDGLGGSNTANTSMPGGQGGCSFLGGQGLGGTVATGGTARTNSGSGGGGGGGPTQGYSGAGGGAGGFIQATISSPVATYAYAIGTGGAAGGNGSGGYDGGVGAAGIILVKENYQ